MTAVLCAAAIVAATVGPFWRIREVSVEGTHHVAVDTVVNASALDGAQTFTASAARARERLLTLPAVRDARIEITVPDRAGIVVTERAALGRWVAAGLEWFVDADGVLFASIDPRAAPELRVTDERGARRNLHVRDRAELIRRFRLPAKEHVRACHERGEHDHDDDDPYVTSNCVDEFA